MTPSPATPASPTPFEHSFTVRFAEVDLAGVVYFQRAFDFAHRAFEELLVAVGCDLATLLGRGYGLPLVHAEADYQRPMMLGERLTVSGSVEHCGSSSLRLVFVIRGDAADDVRATVRLVHVAVAADSSPANRARPDGFRRIELPDFIRDGLRQLGLIEAEGAED